MRTIVTCAISIRELPSVLVIVEKHDLNRVE
jgi:hypothetical protein